MPVINLLDKQVAELIAAGEVVDCPASVVKELVENAIDAGASSITVEIKNGGVKYLRVTDNGCGIDRQQVAKAFLRHATSKIRGAEDLAAIGTLGFRGEALASIAAVCRAEIITRTAGELAGTRYAIEGGDEQPPQDAGCPVGTTLVVRDIFYNTPARMKFLKKDVAEGNLVAAVLDKAALSHPEVAFRFIRDGETRLITPGDSRLQSAIYAVYGREFASSLVAVDYESRGLRLVGFITKPERSRASRTLQNFTINGRTMRSRTCAAALDEAYKHTTMVGKFPACVLDVQIPAGAVDVNVHPAKIEVRFADEKAIFDLVCYGCKAALGTLGQATAAADRGFAPRSQVNAYSATNAPTQGDQQHFSAGQYRAMTGLPPVEAPKPAEASPRPMAGAPAVELPRPGEAPRRVAPLAPAGSGLTLRDEPTPLPPALEWEEAPTPLAAQAPQPEPEPAPVPDQEPDRESYTLVGELLETYIVLDSGHSLVLVDKHAAHERILFERLRAGADTSRSQVLLTPLTLTLSKELYGVAVEHLDVFAQLGFGLEDFGGGTLLLREVPVLLGQDGAPLAAEEIAQKLAAHRRDVTPELVDDLFHSIACRWAVKAGSASAKAEMEEIVRLLQDHPELRNCPHGRPVAVEITRRELEKLFGRVV